MKIYLDDLRPAPEGWVLARSVAEAQRIIDSRPGAPDYELSLDFDLGMTADICQTCDNRGWGRFDAPDHPDYCTDCTHIILSDDKSAPEGDALLKWIYEMHRDYPGFYYLPVKIYLHTANPVGRERMRWAVKDLERAFGAWYPEAFN